METTTQTAIKASELRIGNWVVYEDQVGNVYKKKMDFDDFEMYYELWKQSKKHNRFYPIPLTPEILEKCGFERVEEKEPKPGSPLYQIKHERTVF